MSIRSIWRTDSEDRRRPTRLEVIDAAVIPATLAVATFLAATPWLRAFTVPGMPILLVIASAASVSIAALSVRIWHQRPAISYTASAVGFIALLLAAIGPHPGAIWQGFAHGPNRVLTETLPISGGRALLVAPLLLTWLCGAGATELITRARRRRAGMLAAGLGVPVAAFVIAYAATISGPGSRDIAAPLLLCSLAVIAVSSQLVRQAATARAVVGESFEVETRPSRWRPGLVGLASIVVVAIVLAVLVPNLPAMSRQPASPNRTPSLTAASIEDPVDSLAYSRDVKSATEPLLSVHTNRPSTGYLGMAVLDNYDGSTWTFDTTFRPTGGRIPAGPSVTAAATSVVAVQQRDSILNPLPVPFLPALDRPAKVSGLDVAADAQTGMLLPDRAQSGATSFTVLSNAPTVTLATVPSADGIASLTGPDGTSANAISAGDLALPPNTSAAMATALRSLVASAHLRPAGTVQFLQALLTYLQRNDKWVKPLPGTQATSTRESTVKSTAGTSLSGAISAVTFDHAATPEQFASLYAMIARYLGVPARLVTGFRIPEQSTSGLVPAGPHRITNRDAWTWVEIPVAGLGWVVADPTPEKSVSPGAPPPQTGQITPTAIPPRQANAVPIEEITGGHAITKPTHIRVPTSHPLPGWVVPVSVLLGALMLLLLLGPGLAAARRLSRRRSRRQQAPAPLAVGAWLELLDGLQQAGMPPGQGDTSAEVAAEAGRHFGVDLAGPVLEVGTLAERAVCSVNNPPDYESAKEAWESQRSLVRSVHRGLDRRQRARALMSVGSAPRLPSDAAPLESHRPARSSPVPR